MLTLETLLCRSSSKDGILVFLLGDFSFVCGSLPVESAKERTEPSSFEFSTVMSLEPRPLFLLLPRLFGYAESMLVLRSCSYCLLIKLIGLIEATGCPYYTSRCFFFSWIWFSFWDCCCSSARIRWPLVTYLLPSGPSPSVEPTLAEKMEESWTSIDSILSEPLLLACLTTIDLSPTPAFFPMAGDLLPVTRSKFGILPSPPSTLLAILSACPNMETFFLYFDRLLFEFDLCFDLDGLPLRDPPEFVLGCRLLRDSLDLWPFTSRLAAMFREPRFILRCRVWEWRVSCLDFRVLVSSSRGSGEASADSAAASLLLLVDLIIFLNWVSFLPSLGQLILGISSCWGLGAKSLHLASRAY